MTATVQSGQSLADIAIQYCGGLEAWSALAALNGVGMTAAITPGQVIKIPVPVNKRTVAVFKAGPHFPATGEIQPYGSGISWWIIENDFIVQ